MNCNTTRVGALVLCLASAATAFAHGGAYQPPSTDSPPATREPADPAEPAGPGVGGPTTGGPDAGGPATGGGTGGPTAGGPSTGGGSPGGVPTPGGRGGPFDPTRPKPRGSGGPPVDHWTRWWYANRLFLLDLRGRVRDHEVTTPGENRASSNAADGMWRAEVQQALTRALADRDEDISSGAAVALGKAGDPSDAAPLTTVLVDAKRQQPVREAAALGLGLLPPEKGSVVSDRARQALESVAADPKNSERLRGFAVYALGLRGDLGAMPFLSDVAKARAPTWDVPAAAASSLGLSRSDMVRDVLEGLLAGPKREKSRDWMRRVYAAHGLARLGDVLAVPALRAAADDDDVEVRRAAILALAPLASAADTATADVLAHVLHQDRDRACRGMAAVALGRIGPERAEKDLRWAYDNSDAIEQPFAALGLGLLAHKGGHKEVAQMLRRDLEERATADIRAALCIAVGLAGDPAGAPAVRKIAAERGDPEVRAQAAVALGMLGDRAAGVPILRALLKDVPSPAVQREAALALGMLGDRDAVKILLDLVADGGSVYVQGSAAIALGRIGGADASKALLDLLNNDKRPGLARGMAAVALGLLADRTEGRALAGVGADLDWYVLTATASEILDIL